jgi:glycosyltransferase involved in cell wall biosynthesis
MTPPRVTIVQRVMTHYRVPFYTELHERLTAAGIHLEVVHGQPNADEASLGNADTLPGARVIRNRYLPVGDRSLCWQPCLGLIRASDLIIVEQASRLLVNYALIARRAVGGPSVAWWGHGRNLDAHGASRLGESIKRPLARRSDWWFAYTTGTRDYLESIGVPAARITVVQNATDTTAVALRRSTIGPVTRTRLRRTLDLGDGPVGVVLGSLYPAKRPGFVLDAADRIRDAVPDFQLVVIGDGPDRGLVDAAARSRPWVRVLGARTGDAMVDAAATGDVLLNPGLVGLAVLDAFALEIPMITIAGDHHSPEIEYLEDGENGIVLPRDTTAPGFAAATIALIGDTGMQQRLQEGCRDAARRYSVEAMADNFAAGIGAALQVRANGPDRG